MLLILRSFASLRMTGLQIKRNKGNRTVGIIYNGLKKDKPVYRLWLPEQTPETIRRALGNLRPDSEYDNLFNEGITRTYIDWMYGINFTKPHVGLFGDSLSSLHFENSA